MNPNDDNGSNSASGPATGTPTLTTTPASIGHGRGRRVITGTLSAVAVFALCAGVSWAVTRDDSPVAAPDGATSTVRPAPLVDENGNAVAVEADAPRSELLILPDSRTVTYDKAFDAIPARAVLGADDHGTGPIVFDTPLDSLDLDLNPSDVDSGSTDRTTTPVPSTSTPPTITSEGADELTGEVSDDGPRDETLTWPTWRFIDPCADDPAHCADISDALTVGATVLPMAGDPVLPPVQIRSISVSGGKNKGCLPDEVPAGRRAVEVTVNRPASLELRWGRDLAPVGQVARVTPVPATLGKYRENPSRGWTTCVDMAFPTDLTGQGIGASLTVTATVDDGTTDKRVQFVHDDDIRRLVVFSAGKENEIIAMTPRVGEVKLAAVALGVNEDEVAGCARASLRVLPQHPAPGTEALSGEALPADVAATLAPSTGQWVGARFTGLGEAEPYAVCMFSIGRARGNLNGAVEATDAVFVQPPNRERYEIAPVYFERTHVQDRRAFTINIDGGSELCAWVKRMNRDDTDHEDLRSSLTPCQLGRLETPERVIASIMTLYDKTATSYLELPAHCSGFDECHQLLDTRMYSMDVPGPSYGPDVCGATGASCDGVRPRGVLDGIVTLAVRRVESPIGAEFWTIGPNKRVDVNIPPEHYELVDFLHSSLMLGIDGQVIARVHTLVPTNVTLHPINCDGGLTRPMEPMVSVLLSTDHYFELPDRLEVGHCVTAFVEATDPTHEREENTNGMFPPVWRTE